MSKPTHFFATVMDNSLESSVGIASPEATHRIIVCEHPDGYKHPTDSTKSREYPYLSIYRVPFFAQDWMEPWGHPRKEFVKTATGMLVTLDEKGEVTDEFDLPSWLKETWNMALNPEPQDYTGPAKAYRQMSIGKGGEQFVPCEVDPKKVCCKVHLEYLPHGFSEIRIGPSCDTRAEAAKAFQSKWIDMYPGIWIDFATYRKQQSPISRISWIKNS
jgi:hypothetical protein